MTDPRVHEMLAEPFGGSDDLKLNAVEEELMRALTVAGALLSRSVERYRELSARLRREGTSEELRAEALEAAGDLAVALGATDRHNAYFVALDETALRPLTLLSVLGELFHSMVLLTDPEADEFFVGARLTDEELDALLDADDMQDWLQPETALARLRAAGR